MRSRNEHYEPAVPHTTHGRTIMRVLIATTLSVLGIVVLASHPHRASAEDSPPAPIAAAPQPHYATYRGHRIYYRHGRSYFMYHNHRHYLRRVAY